METKCAVNQEQSEIKPFTCIVGHKKERMTKVHRTAKLQLYRLSYVPQYQQVYYQPVQVQYVPPKKEIKQFSLPKKLSIEFLLKEPLKPKQNSFNIVNSGRIPSLMFNSDIPCFANEIQN